mgnify:CR=1 FL=1
MESIGAVKQLTKITDDLERRLENLENRQSIGLFDKIKFFQFIIIVMVFLTALWYWERRQFWSFLLSNILLKAHITSWVEFSIHFFIFLSLFHEKFIFSYSFLWWSRKIQIFHSRHLMMVLIISYYLHYQMSQ